MKVKWTTITEDKSTWPNEYFLIEKEIINFIKKDIDLYSYAECYQCLRWLDGEIKFLLTNEKIEIKNILGLQWRPMPKSTKKSKSESLLKFHNGISKAMSIIRDIKNKSFELDDKLIEINRSMIEKKNHHGNHAK